MQSLRGLIMTRLEQLRADIAPFWVDTWSPRDGVTRYRFFISKHSRSGNDINGYFGPDNGICTAFGWSEATTFACGLMQGYSYGSASEMDKQRYWR